MRYGIAVLVMSAVSVIMSAQDKLRDGEYFPRHEIMLQYGTPTIMEITSTLKSENNMSEYEGGSRNYKFSGVAGAGYAFSLSPRIAVGIYGGVGYASADLYVSNIGDNVLPVPTDICRSEVTSYTGQISGSYIYWRKGAWDLSGALYLGLSYMDEKVISYDNEYKLPKAVDRLKFSYHFTPLKLRYGEAIGGFAEFGFGYRGLVNIGLSVRL